MTGEARPARGRPVLFLVLLLASWLSVRIMTWETPWQVSAGPEVQEPILASTKALPIREPAGVMPPDATVQAVPFAPVPGVPERSPLLPLERANLTPAPAGPFVPGKRAAGHNLLWLSAMAGLPVPREVSAAIERRAAAVMPAEALFVAEDGKARPGRWQADAWLLLREGASRAAPSANRPPSYGASQLGALLAFRLAPRSRHDPDAYLRASKALVAGGETELAAGLGVRPLANVPVRAHVEVRAVEMDGARQLRPAAFLSGGVNSLPLPLHLEASGYAQAGYVGGDFATAFADGSLRIVRPARDAKRNGLDAGLAAWGGAQRDAMRLDIGPTVGVTLDLGNSTARLSADYRLRIAGDAQPASGAALTIIGGF